MKKLIFSLLLMVTAAGAHAISLFPYFVDIAGDFNDGTTAKFSELNIPTSYWRMNPFSFSKISDADSFLKDTLPFSSYQISKDTMTLPDGTLIITYSASSSDGVLGPDQTNEGKSSTLYLIQTPDEPLYVGISEN